MIPKKIHYCWLGGAPKPESVIKCIESWQKYCPDYEIIEWNENNLNIECNNYTKQAYEKKAWGFVPDYLRLWIIYTNGGIYLDTDVQIIKSFDPLLKLKGFAGFEDTEHVALGLGFGAEKGCEFLKLHMEQYDHLSFINEDGSLNRTPSPQYTTALLRQYGLSITDGVNKQNICGIDIFPPEYFCPKSFETGITRITKNTFSIHQFDGSWCSEEELNYKRARWEAARKDYNAHRLNRFFMGLLGTTRYNKFKKIFKKLIR